MSRRYGDFDLDMESGAAFPGKLFQIRRIVAILT